MVDHIGLYSVMELLIMIGWDDGLGQVNDVQWLFKENVIAKLVAKLDPKFDTVRAHRAVVSFVYRTPILPYSFSCPTRAYPCCANACHVRLLS